MASGWFQFSFNGQDTHWDLLNPVPMNKDEWSLGYVAQVTVPCSIPDPDFAIYLFQDPEQLVCLSASSS